MFVDDPLRPSSKAEHVIETPISSDFMTRLKFAYPPSSLRVFNSGSETKEAAISSAKEALEPDEFLVGGLKVIIGFGDGQRDSLSATAEDFSRIVEECEFPHEFAQSILTNNGSLARFTDYEDADDETEAPSALSVIIQTPYSPFMNFSCVLRTDVSDRSTTCLFFQKERRQLDNFIERLRTKREELHQNPLSIINLLFEEHGYRTEKYREGLDKNVVEMERQTGHTSIAFALHAPSPDYELFTRQLNACKTSLIFLDNMTVFERELGTFCRQTLEAFDALWEDYSLIRGEPRDRPGWLSLRERFAAQQRVDYHLNLAQMRRTQSLSLERRVQTQISLLYSLISQRDSKINIMVAEGSQKTAISVKRDSTAMKTISIVTMVFLPGTFVASVFSAGIFNFAVTTEGARIEVARYWWVYFVITFSLTLVTVLVWAFYTRQRNSEEAKEEEEDEKARKQL